MSKAAWSPQPGPQSEAIAATWCEELLFGGARGGGKSHFLLGDFLQDVERYQSHWQGILFRKTYPELADLIRESHLIYPRSGGVWREGDYSWTWPSGAKLRFRHAERVRDIGNYQGHQYPWIGFDELGNLADPDIYHGMKACLRWAPMPIPTKRIRSSANPGGAGHGWIKDYFIDHCQTGHVPRVDVTKHRVMFIPSKVTDNLILLANDPGYVDRLRGVGSEQLVKAWLSGDWNAIVGAYFGEFSHRHLTDPFKIPEHWTRFRAFDWGSARPFCCLWLAVSDGSISVFPSNSLIVYREWYGSSGPNVGLKMAVKDVAEGILIRDQGEQISYAVADPAIFTADGGPSHAETFNKHGVRFRPADNKRIPGWQQIRDRLIGEDEKPLLSIVAKHCSNLVRTLPALQHDVAKLEDVDTDGEDHAGDTLRYGCMSRPYKRVKDKPKKMRTLHDITMNEVWDMNEKGSSRSGRI